MTSNAGSNLNTNSIGFAKQTVTNNKMLEALRDLFRPEFLNRVDEIVVFDSLGKEELLKIVELMILDTQKALNNKDITLNISTAAKEFILEKGTDSKYGARPLRRAIQKHIEDELSEMILKGELLDGQTVEVILNEDNILKFNVR